mgnify:CR=1 FL=1
MPWMTVPIALAITGGASAGAQVYSTRTAGKQNRRAMDATERSDVRAESLERERLAEERRALNEQLAEARREREAQLEFQRTESARKERFYNEAVSRDRERWQDYLRLNEPHWRQGSGVLQNLYDLAGAGSAPEFSMPTQPSPGSGVSYGGSASGAPVSSTMPVARPGQPGRSMPMMPMPSPTSPMSSLQSLMQLANTMPETRMPLAGRNMGLSQLMTAPTATAVSPY